MKFIYLANQYLAHLVLVWICLLSTVLVVLPSILVYNYKPPQKPDGPVIYKMRYMEHGTSIFVFMHENQKKEYVQPELYFSIPVEEKR